MNTLFLFFVFFFTGVNSDYLQLQIVIHPFSKLSNEERLNVCTHARIKANADPAAPMQFNTIEYLGVDIRGIRYPDGRDTYYISLQCPTIPRLYLRFAENSANKIKIMEERNEYMDEKYAFNLKVIRSLTWLGGYDEFTNISTQPMMQTGTFKDGIR